MRLVVALLLTILLLGGCAQSPAPAVPSPQAAQAAPRPVVPQTQPGPAVVDLSLFQIFVPAGSISGDKEFWAYLGSAGLDASVSDLLENNGVRVGVGDEGDWSNLRAILDKTGAETVAGRMIGVGNKGHEIPVTDELPGQTLFFFDQHGLSGHVYDACRNILVLTYAASPTRPGEVHLELCPLVRDEKDHLGMTTVEGKQMVQYTHDQRLYDLGLSVDLPERRFLVIGASPQSERETSIGHQFFTRETKTQRREMIMIFVVNPRPQPIAVRPAGQ